MAWPDGPCLQFFTCEFYDGHSTQSGPCPIPGLDPGGYSIFTLTTTIQDEDAFFKMLASKYGIARDWVYFGTVRVFQEPHCTPGKTDCTIIDRIWKTFPKAHDDFEVPNPKDVVTTAQGGIKTLLLNLLATEMEMASGHFPGSWEDAVDGLSLPVFMIQQAIENMDTVKDIGGEEEEREKKELIFKILTVVCLVLPFAGEAGAALFSAAWIARMAAMLADAGDIAMSIQQIADDPSSAPMAIMGLLIGSIPGFAREASGWRKLGNLRRAADGTQLGKLGGTFSKNNDAFGRVVFRACKSD